MKIILTNQELADIAISELRRLGVIPSDFEGEIKINLNQPRKDGYGNVIPVTSTSEALNFEFSYGFGEKD